MRSRIWVGLIGLCIALLAGCGGLKVRLTHFNSEFAYVATGSVVAQFTVGSDGQLTPLIPATAPSVNAVSIATTANYKFAYAANRSAATVSQYSIGLDGTLTALAPATVGTGTTPVAVVTTPDNRFLYVLNKGSNTISQFSIGVGGALTLLPIATIAVASDGNSLVVTPDSQFLYATSFTSGKISAYSIGVTGQLTALTVPTYNVSGPTGPSISPDGNYLYVPLTGGEVAQFGIGPDGSLTPLSAPTVSTPNSGDDSIAISPNGFYAYVGLFNGGIAGSPVGQFSRNLNGTLAPLAPTTVAAGNAPLHVVVDPSGQFVFAANSNDGTVSQFLIGFTGALTALTPATVNSTGALQIAFARK